MKMQTFFELLAQFNGVFFLFLGFTLKGELLFFACTKKTNEKKVHPGGWSLRDFPRLSLLCGTVQHGPSGAGLH